MKYMEEMVDAICRELELRVDYLEGVEVETIYFGGGTPSLLSESGLERIFETINRLFKVNAAAEITLEANPDDLSFSKLQQLKTSPINRLSIGVQSFHEAELVWMNRAHNAEESLRSILDAQAVGFDNISMDLIFGIPQSSHELWSENLEMTVDLGIPHISMYALTVEPGTALANWVEKGKVVEAPDQYVMEQFDMGGLVLGRSGYVQYEISNYSIPGMEARHNSNYWRSKSYLGVGPSANSYNGVSRSINISHNTKYRKAISEGVLPQEIEKINGKTRYNEYVMTRLRTIWGVDLQEIAEYRLHFETQVNGLIEKGWIKKDLENYTLTPAGKHFADAAAMELFVL